MRTIYCLLCLQIPIGAYFVNNALAIKNTSSLKLIIKQVNFMCDPLVFKGKEHLCLEAEGSFSIIGKIYNNGRKPINVFFSNPKSIALKERVKDAKGKYSFFL